MPVCALHVRSPFGVVFHSVSCGSNNPEFWRMNSIRFLNLYVLPRGLLICHVLPLMCPVPFCMTGFRAKASAALTCASGEILRLVRLRLAVGLCPIRYLDGSRRRLFLTGWPQPHPQRAQPDADADTPGTCCIESRLEAACCMAQTFPFLFGALRPAWSAHLPTLLWPLPDACVCSQVQPSSVQRMPRGFGASSSGLRPAPLRFPPRFIQAPPQ